MLSFQHLFFPDVGQIILMAAMLFRKMGGAIGQTMEGRVPLINPTAKRVVGKCSKLEVLEVSTGLYWIGEGYYGPSEQVQKSTMQHRRQYTIHLCRLCTQCTQMGRDWWNWVPSCLVLEPPKFSMGKQNAIGVPQGYS